MLTLEDANRVVAAALSYARDHGYQVSASVSDTLGYPVAHQRMDGCLPMSPRYSVGKAVASAGYGVPSEQDSTADLHSLPISLAVNAGMPLTRVPGGVPLIQDGEVVGGIGVSGSPSMEADEECAKHAAEATGFATRPRRQ